MPKHTQSRARMDEVLPSEGSSSSSPERIPYDDSDYYTNVGDESNASIAEQLPHFRDMAVSTSARRRKTPSSLMVMGEPSRRPPVYQLPPELLIAIFQRLVNPADLRTVMLVCKAWASCSVDLLWHRPYITKWQSLHGIVAAIRHKLPTFAYAKLIRRLNLTFLAENISDGTLVSLQGCSRLERLTLTNCKKLTDSGLANIIPNNPGLLALELSSLELITDVTLAMVAKHCKKLQGLSLPGCSLVTDASLIPVSMNCRQLKRLKLNDCTLLTDETAFAMAENCPQLLEIDLHKCHNITDAAVIHLLENLRFLRELRLAYCDLLTDDAFLSLPNRTYDSLRILDLTSCERLTDKSVEKIVAMAPRLRNLALAKCKLLSDRAVTSICGLGRNIHYLALGHCPELTDDAVRSIARHCSRIRYIDLAGCNHLTDSGVSELAALPKLRRIGLVKCTNITDEAILALVTRIGNLPCPLERVHLSYCIKLTIDGIHKLLNACMELTHLSLTGVEAFLKEELTQFCRQAPEEFTDNQRRAFCVFSGSGVVKLRNYLNKERDEHTGMWYDGEDDSNEMDSTYIEGDEWIR